MDILRKLHFRSAWIGLAVMIAIAASFGVGLGVGRLASGIQAGSPVLVAEQQPLTVSPPQIASAVPAIAVPEVRMSSPVAAALLPTVALERPKLKSPARLAKLRAAAPVLPDFAAAWAAYGETEAVAPAEVEASPPVHAPAELAPSAPAVQTLVSQPERAVVIDAVAVHAPSVTPAVFAADGATLSNQELAAVSSAPHAATSTVALADPVL